MRKIDWRKFLANTSDIEKYPFNYRLVAYKMITNTWTEQDRYNSLSIVRLFANEYLGWEKYSEYYADDPSFTIKALAKYRLFKEIPAEHEWEHINLYSFPLIKNNVSTKECRKILRYINYFCFYRIFFSKEDLAKILLISKLTPDK